MPNPPRQMLGFGRHPNTPLSRREVHRAGFTLPRGVYPDESRRPRDPRDRPIRDTMRMQAPIRAFGKPDDNGTIVGLSSLNRAPKGSDGCTVRSLDYIGKAPSRKGKVD